MRQHQHHLLVLFFSVGLALLTGIVFGISPALQSARPDVAHVMQANTRKITALEFIGRRTHSHPDRGPDCPNASVVGRSWRCNARLRAHDGA